MGTDAPSPTDRVEFLRERAWPDEPVEVIETHMSWVFLAGERAYKLKKAVHQPYLDLRDVAARHADCEAEFALNQTLAPGVYLGVEPLCADESGALRIGGGGRPVDWLVVMRRLDRTTLLDRRILDGTATVGELDPVLDSLVRFYRTAAPLPATPDEHRRRLIRQVESDRHEMARREYGLDDDHRRITTVVLERIASDAELGTRAARLVDGHGDLRPEHIRPGPDPLVLDRLSFDPDLRRIDPPMDLALLAVECERLGAPGLGRHVLAGYRSRADDAVGEATLRLYQAVRAITRARLSIAHLDDHGGDHERRRWTARCEQYLRIAATHADPSGPPDIAPRSPRP